MLRVLSCHGRDFSIRQRWILSIFPQAFQVKTLALFQSKVPVKLPWICNRKEGLKKHGLTY